MGDDPNPSVSNGTLPPRTRQLSEGYDETHQRVQKVYELMEKHKGAGPSHGHQDSSSSGNAAASNSNRGSGHQRSNGNSRGGKNSPSPHRNQSQSPSPSKEGPRKSSSSGRTKSSSPQNPPTQEEAEARELEKLRCPSERAEVGSEREERRRKRCADYPGLGASVFASDTLMKFSIIRNELHNVINGQLKRVETEVGTLTKRLQNIEEDLAKSEVDLGSATTQLASAAEELAETDEIRTALESYSYLENDDRLDQLQAFLCPPKPTKEEIG